MDDEGGVHHPGYLYLKQLLEMLPDLKIECWSLKRFT